MENRIMRGKVPAESVKQFFRELLQEVYRCKDEWVVGKATIREQDVHTVFILNGVQVDVKLKNAAAL